MARTRKTSSKPKKRERASRKSEPAPAADVLEEVDTGGPGIDEGIVFTTFVLLAGAFFLLYTLLQDRYPDAI